MFTIVDPVEGLIDFDALRNDVGYYGATRISTEVLNPRDSFRESHKRDIVFTLEGFIDVVEFELGIRRDCVESYNV